MNQAALFDYDFDWFWDLEFLDIDCELFWVDYGLLLGSFEGGGENILIIWQGIELEGVVFDWNLNRVALLIG